MTNDKSEAPERNPDKIDELRFKAFKTNDREDVERYYKAASAYFQDRHIRAMERESADLAQPMCAAVKPLVFEVFDKWTCWAETGMGNYSIRTRDDGAVILEFRGETIRYFDEDNKDWGGWPSIEAAQRGANNHYTRRINEALDMKTVAEVREECVQRVADWFDQFTAGEVMTCDFEDLAQAIREGKT